MQQGHVVINAKGKAKPPPSADDVLTLVAEAVVRKQPLTLQPGEVRVLHDWLITLEQGNPEKLIRSVQMWRVYYDDGSIYDGDVEKVPSLGVICIVQPDPDHGRHVLSRWDYYCWHDPQWFGHDIFGLWDCLAQPGYNRILFGRTIGTAAFREVIARAEADTGFPPRSARTSREP